MARWPSGSGADRQGRGRAPRHALGHAGLCAAHTDARLPRELAERLSARAIREERNLEALVEIIDPDTRAPLPDGEPGNMRVTALFKDGVYPIVRFDTSDVSVFLTSASGPGLTLRRIRGFQGRSDQMVKLRGVNVYPTAIGAHLALHPAATGAYVCRVERRGTRDEMTVVVEARPGEERRGLEAELEALLRQKLGVEVAVELVGLGATAPLTELEGRHKPIRLIDRRR